MSMTKNFISFMDFTQADLVALLDLADTLREAWEAKRLPQALAGKSIALIWDAEGFRNAFLRVGHRGAGRDRGANPRQARRARVH